MSHRCFKSVFHTSLLFVPSILLSRTRLMIVIKFRSLSFGFCLFFFSQTYFVLDILVAPKSFQFNLIPGVSFKMSIDWLFRDLFFASLCSSSLLGCATHLTWMAGVVEMFSEVNTTWVEDIKVVNFGKLHPLITASRQFRPDPPFP